MFTPLVHSSWTHIGSSIIGNTIWPNTSNYTPTHTYGPMTHAIRSPPTNINPTITLPAPLLRHRLPKISPASSSSATHHGAFSASDTYPHFLHSQPTTSHSSTCASHNDPFPLATDSRILAPYRYTHWDSNVLHSHQLFRAIQPTQWSQKVGIAGLPIFDIYPGLLAYHGTADFTARALSHGKYCGLIPTRSVAESVCSSHTFFKICATSGWTYIDAATEAGCQSPSCPCSSSSRAAGGSAIRELKAKSEDFERAQAKLMAYGLQLTPRKDAKERTAAPPVPPTLPEAAKPPVLADVLQPPHP